MSRPTQKAWQRAWMRAREAMLAAFGLRTVTPDDSRGLTGKRAAFVIVDDPFAPGRDGGGE